jgi:hypothetical protein
VVFFPLPASGEGFFSFFLVQAMLFSYCLAGPLFLYPVIVPDNLLLERLVGYHAQLFQDGVQIVELPPRLDTQVCKKDRSAILAK